MLIDWFTLVAQIVNFVVLVGLMKHFLFGRLVRAIDAREQRIAARIEEAGQKNREAERRIADAQAETDRISQQHDRILAEAREEAGRERQELLRKARESVQALETRWHEDLERDQTAFFDELRSRAATKILEIARRALADLASAELDGCALDAFLKKLPSIGKSCADGDVMIRSAGDLSAEARRRIEAALPGARVRFERAPQMPWGLELRMNGKRIGWNPESYLGALEENVRQALEHRRA